MTTPIRQNEEMNVEQKSGPDPGQAIASDADPDADLKAEMVQIERDEQAINARYDQKLAANVSRIGRLLWIALAILVFWAVAFYSERRDREPLTTAVPAAEVPVPPAAAPIPAR